MDQYSKFYNYLSETNEHQKRLADLLLGKLEAVRDFDILRLDEIIKEEQVFVLMSKSFDTHMESFREGLSLKGTKLSEMIEELPQEEQQRFRTLFGELKASLAQSKELNDKCQGMLEERLYMLNKYIKTTDKSAGADYGKPAASNAAGGEARLLTRSV